MVLAADHADHLREAFASGAGSEEAKCGGVGGDGQLSGVWQVDKKRTAFDGLDMYLAAIRVPAVFRGLAKGGLSEARET